MKNATMLLLGPTTFLGETYPAYKVAPGMLVGIRRDPRGGGSILTLRQMTGGPRFEVRTSERPSSIFARLRAGE